MDGMVLDRYVLVIDTDKYAGNFEREMVAFITGQVGECEVGLKARDAFRAEFPDLDFEDLVIDQPNEHGCWRPASIWPSPYFWNDGYGNHHRNEVPPDAPEVLAALAVSLEEAYERTRAAYAHMPEYAEELVAEKEERCTPGNYPAYMSVACFLDKTPDEETLTFFVERAKTFCGWYSDRAGGTIEFLGARLIRQKTVDEDIAVF